MTDTRTPELPSGDRPDVAFVLPRLEGGGIERVVLNLATSLSERSRSVDLVLMRAEGELLEQVPARVRIVDLKVPLRGDATFGLSLPSLIQYLRARRPHLLYSGMTSVNLTALAARRLARSRTSLVVSEHVPISVNARTHPLKRMLPHLARVGYRHADAIVAVAQDLADDLVSSCGLPRERIDVIYNPVVTPRLRRDRHKPAPHRWFADDVPVVLGIGRLHAQKDFTMLLEAFTLVRAERPARLIVLGEGPERPRLEELARRFGVATDVDLHGFVDDPATYLAHSDVFALSSRYEGLAVVVAEALACGCQVVSTDCMTGPSEILEGGRYGRLVPVGDATAMASAVSDALDAPFPAAALLQRSEVFDVERITDRYVALFDRVTKPT